MECYFVHMHQIMGRKPILKPSCMRKIMAYFAHNTYVQDLMKKNKDLESRIQDLESEIKVRKRLLCYCFIIFLF